MEDKTEPEVIMTLSKRPRTGPIGDPDSKKNVSLIKVDVKAANNVINVIPLQGEKLFDLREQIVTALEARFKIQIPEEIKNAFVFLIGKEVVPAPKEHMELEKLLQEMYLKHPSCLQGDVLTVCFNISDLKLQYEFLKLTLPRFRAQTTVAVFVVRQLDAAAQVIKNHIVRIEHNPDYYTLNIHNIRGNLKNSHILRALDIQTTGKLVVQGLEYNVVRLSKSHHTKEKEQHFEDICFLNEEEMTDFLASIDKLRKSEDDSEDEEINAEEGKEFPPGGLNKLNKGFSRNSVGQNLLIGAIGSLQNIEPVEKPKMAHVNMISSQTEIEETKVSKSHFFLKRFNSEGKIESEIQKVLREKQKLKLECQEFSVKVHGLFGIRQKRILRINSDFEFVFYKKEKEKDNDMYTYMSHIPMNDVLKVKPREESVKPREEGASKVIFVFKNENKYSKPLKMDFETEKDASDFFELMNMIIKLFHSSANSFKTEKEQQGSAKMYPWLVRPKQDQLVVEFEHGHLKTIQFKVVNTSNFGESQIVQINLQNAILLFKLVDGTVEKRIGLHDIYYCEADFKDPRGLSLVLKNKKYSLLFCDIRSRMMFEAVVYDTTTPQFKLAQRKVFEPEKLRVYCSTFNAGFALPQKSLNLWLQHSKDSHIIAIAMQECDTAEWLEAIETYYSGDNFTLVTVVTMWKMLICVFVASEYATYVTNVEVGSKATGIADLIGNKGGVAISFRVLETSFCFIGAHLAAQPENMPLRKVNFYNLMKYLRLGDDQIEVTAVFDYIFFISDANFRLDCNFYHALNTVNKGDLESLLPNDQLVKARTFENFMTIFHEGKIAFKPTYRRNREDEGYSNKKNQAPSWTDRVFIKSRPNRPAVIQEYNSVEMFLMSDHRPVYCISECKVDYPYLPKRPLYLRDPNLLGVIKFVDLTLKYNFTLYDQMDDFEEPLAWPLNLSIHLRSRFLSKYATTLPLELKNTFTVTKWKQEMIPLLYCVIADRKYLKGNSLLALLKVSQEDDDYEALIGQADIPLNELMENEGTKTEFKTDVFMYGRQFGTLTGTFLFEQP